MNIRIELAGVPLRIGLNLDETKRYFKGFITEENCEGFDIKVNEEDIKEFPLICTNGILDPFSETYVLMIKACDFLLDYNRVIIHGVSFVWHDKAWLITAPSGTGKTTQLRHWQRLWNDEIQLINGDKSVLELRDNNELWLHPSPWMGKEKDYGDSSGKLAGIIVLEQADHNSVKIIKPAESVLQIFQQFLFLGKEAEHVRNVGKIETVMLDTLPVWLLENLGDEESARLTYETLSDYEASIL